MSAAGAGREAAVLAIDLGTTEVKAGLVALDGRLLGLARAGYGTTTDATAGRAEQDPEAWWGAVGLAVRELVRLDVGEVSAIGVDGHGPTLVPVDGAGRATRPAIIWQDTRSTAEAAELAIATGLQGWSLAGLPAALWLDRHEPEAAAVTRWWLATWDWLAFRLTGEARTSLVDGQPFPASDALTPLGLDAARIAPPIRAGDVVGSLSREAAAALRLRAGVPVVAGIVDAWASYHGAGMTRPGDAMDPGGSAGGFGVYAERPLVVPGSFSTIAPLPGLYSVGGAMAATGRALDWFRLDLGAGAATTETLLEEAGTVPAGAGGVVFLPYLAGERSPLWDPSARGAFVGLSLGHGRAHLTRAILEASAFSIRHVAESILAAGAEVRTMRVCGGPARSELWNRIKADVTGFPIEVPAVLETAVAGSAMVAATAVGAWRDLPAAIHGMTRIVRRLEPDPATRPAYDATYAAYRALHPAIAPIVRELQAAAG
ncbi:MAG TPA: FGGY-family carbohydrate kinase [Candidatus Limnocylindrales bacterium]|nr:FGGY-family carbohydrate kinase [Candidatus Limnocylindrales bacterium]